MIIETCPKCGAELERLTIATYTPVHVVRCHRCGFSHEEKDKIEYRTYIVPSESSGLNITMYSDGETITIPIKQQSTNATVENKEPDEDKPITGQDLIKYIIENKAYDLPVYRMGEPFHGEEYPVKKIISTESEYGGEPILLID